MLRVEGLSKSFLKIRAVSKIGFAVKKGSITALIGPNGAGKTTTFNMITGFLKADTGRVTFEDADITGRSAHAISRQGCIRTFQGVEAFPGMSVFDNVMIGASRGYCHGITSSLLKLPAYRKREVQARLHSRASIEAVGLADLVDKPSSLLSFGQLRLMEIARALATGPRLLLLDEPGAGLNSIEVENLALVLRRLNAQGITLFIIDHDMKLVMDISDTVIVMDKGEHIASGTPHEVQGNQAVIDAYLGG